ncbi:MAG: UDP-N-acetylglucosamine 2-epimerase (non-hydrolyzing) [Dehalococcoidales bacterium]|nr:UDP-N-acetylglucosamine 2-epimerase (non-hydrolyzing) [Dehalococcoidales bacterium]
MKTAVVVGTRPEIIKMSPVIRELESRGTDYFILHTGQHYSYNMDGMFFAQLKLPQAKYNLGVGSGSHAEETAKIIAGTETVLLCEKPDIILVEGDTNSVLGAALTAAKLNIGIGHVEAGLRSYDRNMPEEINRILVDHCSDYLFAPTVKSRGILLGEGIDGGRIFVTGNTVVDAVQQNIRLAVDNLGYKPKGYFLLTLHRQENVDNPSSLRMVIDGISTVAHEYGMPVVCPIHPRTRRQINEYDMKPGFTLIDPVDYLQFLWLENNARLVLTDSGGVQEECCTLDVPCVTLRSNTERPETIDVGANILSGTSSQRILECTDIMLKRRTGWQKPFGDGKAGQRVVDIITGGGS